MGGPIMKDKVFFFVDYQGTRTTQGITSPVTSVPSLRTAHGNLERCREFADGDRERAATAPTC